MKDSQFFLDLGDSVHNFCFKREKGQKCQSVNSLRVSFPKAKTCTPLIVDPPRFPSKFVFWQMLMRNEQKLEILVIR